MRTDQGQELVDVVAEWDERSVHIWRMKYRRASRREPLRALLGTYLGLPPDEVSFIEGKHGRPQLREPWGQQLRFNWSHSGDTALVVIAREVDPGIDVERVHPRPRAMALAERFFHAEEAAALALLDSTQREFAFLQLWTEKEAVLKAMGRGLAFGLDALCFSIPPAPSRLLWLDGDEASAWQLHTLSLGSDYVGSVAWRGSPRPIFLKTLADDA